MSAKYEVYRTEEDGWFFQLKAPGSQVILVSEVYKSLSGCINGIESCREHATFDRFYGRDDVDSRFSFHVRASNNRTIGHGSECVSVEDREAVIRKVKRYAPSAQIVKRTSGRQERNSKTP